jgi:hypothetical protein
MKRLAAALLSLSFVVGATATSFTLISASPSGNCSGHGYTSGTCTSVGPGQTSSVNAPNAPVTISFSDPYTYPVDLQSDAVATPADAPSGSACFSVQVYDHGTGQVVGGTLKAPLNFSGSGTTYAYDSSSGTYSGLTGNESWSGGIFCNVSGSSTIGLPLTGGAAK